MTELGEKVAASFTRKFKAAPLIICSPGRVNLLGEHIDYNDGYVLPCAINKGVYCAIAPNGSDKVRVFSRDFDELFETDIHKLEPDGDWKNYILGVIDEMQKAGRVLSGFDCVLGGNIPIGAGLASSAAVEGALAFGLNEIFSLGFSRVDLALLCQRAEHGYPRMRCGIMDQYANMMGREGSVLFLDCVSLRHEYIPLELGEYQIVLMNSRVHHALASSAYNTRRSECETGLNVIRENSSITSFREFKNAKGLCRFEDKMGKFVFKRCRFVVDEINRARMGARLLRKKRLKEFGALMYESHEGLSNLFKVSCAELDFLVQIARANPDVIGSRMMGGGFGGCTINLVRTEGKQKFVEEALRAYRKEFQQAAEAYDVTTADGTTIVQQAGNA